MTKSKSNTQRYHFSVPISDIQVHEWIRCQNNYSMSLRIVIKDYIAKHGMIDSSCLPMSINDKAVEETIRRMESEQAVKPKAVEKVIRQEPAEIRQTENVISMPVQPSAPMNDMLADLMK